MGGGPGEGKGRELLARKLKERGRIGELGAPEIWGLSPKFPDPDSDEHTLAEDELKNQKNSGSDFTSEKEKDKDQSFNKEKEEEKARQKEA